MSNKKTDCEKLVDAAILNDEAQVKEQLEKILANKVANRIKKVLY